MELKIYDKRNSLRATLVPDGSSTHHEEVGGDDYLSVSLDSPECVTLELNDWTVWEGRKFWCVEAYTPRQMGQRKWSYSVKLYGAASLIRQALILNTESSPVFAYTATAREHVALVVRNLNRWMGGITDWKVGMVEATGNIVIDYSDGLYGNDALKKIAEEAGTEWWIEDMTVNVCRCERGNEVTLGYGNGLVSMERDNADNVKFFTRLFPIGSSRNIDAEKYGSSRLLLPSRTTYVERNTEMGIVEHFEQTAFQDIYPKRTGEVSSVRKETRKGDDGEPFDIYYFTDHGMSFDPNQYEIGGLVKRVTFQTGQLAGLGNDEGSEHYFEVNYDSTAHEFELVTIWPYDDDTQVPGGVLEPKAGDTYILWNVRMPDEYYPIAEQEYAAAVDKYMDEHCRDRSVYKCSTDYAALKKRGVTLGIGQRVRLESDRYFETGYRESRITVVDQKLERPTEADIEISDVLSQTAQSRMADEIEGVRSEMKANTVELPDMIRSWDTTLPTDNNLFSARRSQQEFLSKKRDDRTKGRITFERGVAFGLEENATIDGKGNVEVGTLAARGGVSIGDDSYIKADGAARLGDVLLDALRSETFDDVLQRGFGLVRNAQGRYTLSVHDLMVWGKAMFNSAEIRRLYSVGGNVYLSGASGRIQHVTPLYASDGVTVSGWKCWLLADDGTTATQNGFVRYDQARCQTFNIEAGVHEGVGNRYYWRLVTDASTASEQITDDGGNVLYDGKRFAWVVLSASDCENPKTNDAPAEGDVIVLDGHRQFAEGDEQGRDKYNDRSRTNVMMLQTTGTDTGATPNIVALTGITNYRHSTDANKYANTVFILSPEEVVFVSARFKWVSASGDPIVMVNFRGPWEEDTAYYYYDQVSHGNALWTCVVADGKYTMEEPSDTSTVWRKELTGGVPGEKGEDGVAYLLQVTSDRGTVLVNGSGTLTLTGTLYRNGEDITSTIASSYWSWYRVSADTADDAVWGRLHEGKGNTCVITSEDVSRVAQFGCRAYVPDATLRAKGRIVDSLNL